MITRRARVVTDNSIKALLSKVCYRSNSADSIKFAALGKSLSTATEAFPYYQNPVGNDRNDSYPEYNNQVRVASDRSLNSVQFNQGSRNESNRNPVSYGVRVDSFEKNSKVGYGGNWDRSNVHVSGDGNFEARNAVDRYGENGDVYGGGGGQSFDGNAGRSCRNSNGHGDGAYRQNWDGYKWSNVKELPQNSRDQPANLSGLYHQSRDVNYRGGDGGNLHNGSMGQFSRNLGGLRSENGGAYHRDGANVTNHQADGQRRMPSESNSSVSNFGQYQPADNNNHAQSNFGQYQSTDNNNHAQSNFGQYQPADNNNHAQSNLGQYQPADNNNYAPGVGGYQHAGAQNNGIVGSQTANHYQYQGPNVAGYQQNPYGNLIYNRNATHGPLQSNLNAPYPSTISQVPGYSNTDRNSTDALETQQIRGTIEELEQYTKEGKLKEALEVLELLEKNQQRLIPERDMSTAIMLIEACGDAKADKEAKIVHKALVKLLTPLTLSTYNKMMEMYLKCGSIEEAYSLFNDIPNTDLASWDVMIRGLTKNDLGEEAIDIFTEFKNTELKPDGQMFLGVFLACGIVGDVAEGMLHFQSMSKEYGITPSMQHYVGVVEMLGHAGYLDNALEFIENMPVKPSVDVWETLMHVSRIQGNVELGDRCAELVEKLDPSRLSEQSKAGLIPLKASDLEKEKEKKKLASKNLLEVRSRVHEYRAGDTSHPENDRIYALLRGLKTQMKEAGYIPELRGVLHDIDPEGKEEALLAHSERLAAAYGFLTTAARQPIRVIKNLRVCVDCHNALKIISKLVGRELIMRDAKRFHHFKDGVCSCKDYW